jgi:hypothetical protein
VPAERALLSGLLDHAPLFPPASLPLEEALEDHRRALASPHAWMVARFICPASRLGELDGERLRLSVVADIAPGELDERVEAIEGRDPDLARLGRETYLEGVALDEVKAAGARAKVRCGPEPPPVEELAAFIRRCRAEGIPFKATAGLHHALRADGQLGFLNVLAAAVFGDEERALSEQDADVFALGETFRWRDREAGADEVAEVRRSLFVSIGSCSFFEPVEELEALGFL